MNARILASLIFVAPIAACSPSPGAKAEQAYEIVKKNALDRREVCKAARAARDAWLSEGNEKKYELAEIRAYGDCAGA